MKKRLAISMVIIMILGLFCGCSAQSSGTSDAGSATRVITDMAGRTVTIPSKVKSVYCAVPTAEAMISSLCPDKLIGWVNKPTEASLKYLPERFATLPVIGGWMGQKVTANMEDIIKLNPDVIIYMTNEYALAKDETPKQIETQTGKPVIVVPSDLKYTAEVYRFLGDCLSETERGEKLASYCEEKMTQVKDAMAKVPEAEKRSVYYAENPDGLATDPAGSGHTEVLDFVGVKNVADVEMLTGMGLTTVTIEQIINWNPDVMLVSTSSADTYKNVMTNAIWKDIKAVQDGRIYVTPAVPFNWFDRPPNTMRVLGIQWFASVMYPNYISYDINSEIKEYFNLFYNVKLTDDEVKTLLATPSIS